MVKTFIITVADIREIGEDYKDHPNVIVTGIGQINSLIALSKVCKTNPITKIFNVGSCVAKHESNVDQIIYPNSFLSSIRSFSNDSFVFSKKEEYLPIETHFEFLTSADNFRHCGFADMEAYAQASFCQSNKIDFECIKYVSDWVENTSMDYWESILSKIQENLNPALKRLLEAS